jgi:hypothetical protein
MTNVQSSASSQEVQSLKNDIHALENSLQESRSLQDWWNGWYLRLGVAALVLATFLGIASWVCQKKASTIEYASRPDTEKLAAKNARLREVLDQEAKAEVSKAQQQAGESNRTAGEANERAGKANERAAALEVEALKLREQLLAQGPREALLRGDKRAQLVDALRPFTGQRIDVRRSAFVIEANSVLVSSMPIGDDTTGLAVALIGVVRDAGWESPSEPLLCSVESQGLEILVVNGASEKTMQAAIALGRSLQSISLQKVHGPVFADESRAARIVTKEPVLPPFDKDTIVVEVLTHP